MECEDSEKRSCKVCVGREGKQGNLFVISAWSHSGAEVPRDVHSGDSGERCQKSKGLRQTFHSEHNGGQQLSCRDTNLYNMCKPSTAL